MNKKRMTACLAVLLSAAVMTACGEKDTVTAGVSDTSAAPVTTVSETLQTETETETKATEAVTETSAAETSAAEETVGSEAGTVYGEIGNSEISAITGEWYCRTGMDGSEILTLTVHDDGSYTLDDTEDGEEAGSGTVKAEYDKLGRIFVFYSEKEEQPVRGFLFNSPASQWLSLEYDNDTMSTVAFSRTPGGSAEEYRNDLNEHYNELRQLIKGNWETVSFSDENGNTVGYDLSDPVHRSYYVGLSIDPMAQTGLIIGTVGHPAGEVYFGNRIDVGPAVLHTNVSRQFEIGDDLDTLRVCIIDDGSITATLKRVDSFSIDEYSASDSGYTAEDYCGVWCSGNTYIAIGEYDPPAGTGEDDFAAADGDHIVTVTEKLGPEESIEWEYICSFRAQTGIMVCEGFAKCTDYYCDAEGNETITEIYEDGTGFFELRDDQLYWTDYKENAGLDHCDTNGFYRLSDPDT